MDLNDIKPAEGAKKNRRRVGRGIGSGLGKTAGRGHKGQKSRSGGFHKVGFEGGQMPLQRRLPKFGFTNPTRIEYKPINLDTLQELATLVNLTTIDFAVLREHGLAGKNDLIKVLSRGEVTSVLEVSAHGFSSSAKEAIEKAGGKVIVIDRIAKKETAI